MSTVRRLDQPLRLRRSFHGVEESLMITTIEAFDCFATSQAEKGRDIPIGSNLCLAQGALQSYVNCQHVELY